MQIKRTHLLFAGLALLCLVFYRRLYSIDTGGSGTSSAFETLEVHTDVNSAQPQAAVPTQVLKIKLSANGVPEGSYEWTGGSLLPEVFPTHQQDGQDVTTVCVFERNPRQRSLFSTNMLSLFGSGKFTYQTMTATECQHYGTCKTKEESNIHPLCPPGSPTIGLVEWVKCCFHDRFTSAMTSPTQNWDLAIATGDEYCAATDRGRAHFRFYNRNNLTTFLPLGPREEFTRVRAEEVVPATNRKYLFNFVGSLTSTSRKVLAAELRSNSKKTQVNKRGFVHVVDEWSKVISHKNGYLLPSEYRLVLMNSTFTLCPDGHNPESYRIYEALEAGSIPVLVMDQSYEKHSCQNAFQPLLDAKAPFVFLDSWRALGKYLESVNDKQVFEMQANAMAWYSQWMKTKAAAFEEMLEVRYNARRSEGN